MSKPNLPPLPLLPASLPHLGKGDIERIRMWTTAYAEEAVRQALAAQEPVAWLYHNGKPGVVPDPRDMCTSVLLTLSRQPWCRNETPLAIIPESSNE